MHPKEFNEVVDNHFDTCKEVLKLKEVFYGGEEDRLVQFKKIHILTGVPPRVALGVLMSKHITALYDYLNSDMDPLDSEFDEKITDISNYLVLLKGELYDEHLQGEGEEREPAEVGPILSSSSERSSDEQQVSEPANRSASRKR